MSTNMINNPKIVSREEWLAARKELLAKEKRSRASATLSLRNGDGFRGSRSKRITFSTGRTGR